MLTIRNIVKEMVDTIPEEKLKKVFEIMEGVMEKDTEKGENLY